MTNRFESMAQQLYKKSFKIFRYNIRKAIKEAKKDKLSPIYTFSHIMETVNSLFKEFEEALESNSIESMDFNEQVFSLTDKYLLEAEKEVKQRILEIRTAPNLETMIAKSKELKRILTDSRVIDYIDLFAIDFNNKNPDSLMPPFEEYNRFIFDIDYTIFIPDWSKEDDYFKEHIPVEEQEEFFKQKQDIIDEFEATHEKYDLKELSEFFKQKGFTVSEEVIKGWLKHNAETIQDEVVPGVKQLFSHLKEKGKTIVILTNWFGEMQIRRLERAGLLQYVDKIVSGDIAMKPKKEAFIEAQGEENASACLVVGDSIRNDLKGAQNAGLDCYLVDQNHTICDLLSCFIVQKDIMRHIKTPNQP